MRRARTNLAPVPDFNSAPHPHPRIIGLSGWATSGKDETARVLGTLYGYRRIAFADQLKRFVREISPILFYQDKDPIRVAEFVAGVGDLEAKTNGEYRRLLQVIGLTAREMIGEDVWVDMAMKEAAQFEYAVFSDVRFPNEFDRVHEMGGKVLRIMRPGVKPINDHPSETALDSHHFDGYVMNDSNLVDLEGEVQRVLGDLG